MEKKCSTLIYYCIPKEVEVWRRIVDEAVGYECIIILKATRLQNANNALIYLKAKSVTFSGDKETIKTVSHVA